MFLRVHVAGALHSLHAVEHGAARQRRLLPFAASSAQTTLLHLVSFSLHLCSDVEHRIRVAPHPLLPFVHPRSLRLSLCALVSARASLRILTEPWFVGNTYSIRNVGSSTSRVFFSQAFEKSAEAED